MALLSLGLGCRDSRSKLCGVCRRALHGHTRTVAEIEGRREVFCCPACVFTAERQRHRAARLLEVADYETESALVPQKATFVLESKVNPCRSHAVTDDSKHAAHVAYDRCSPSILAFRTREAARAFSARHGGRVVGYGALR